MAEYEFSTFENVGIARCGRRALLWGGCSGTAGLAAAALGLAIIAAGHLTATAVTLVMIGGYVVAAGLCLVRGGLAFVDVATTSGRDVTHLLRALQQLSRAFLMLSLVVILGTVGLSVVLLLRLVPIVPVAH
jgi:hypothetical protein